MYNSLETVEQVEIVREYDEHGNVIKETRTVKRPARVPEPHGPVSVPRWQWGDAAPKFNETTPKTPNPGYIWGTGQPGSYGYPYKTVPSHSYSVT
jgi:hypothetical protein